MATITRLPGLCHLRSTEHIQHRKGGQVRHRGRGLSFWYSPLSAVLAEVPVSDSEITSAFRARTADFQDVMVQGTITYRISDPDTAADRIDFSIDPRTGAWVADPRQQLQDLLGQTAQQFAIETIADLDLATALQTGMARLRSSLTEQLRAAPRMLETGLSVVDVRIVSLRCEADVEQALQTPVRERIQTESDRSTYERRALAVERERAISENELANQIALAHREEELVAQRGANARRKASDAAEADAITVSAEAHRMGALATATAERTRTIGAADAAARHDWLANYEGLPEPVLQFLAMDRLAENLPRIQSLVITPDLLSQLLSSLGDQMRSMPELPTHRGER